jgi:GDP-L-fucose synthase
MLDAYRAQYGLNGVYLLPANLYGPGDNFDPDTSHVIPALIRKFCEAADTGAESVECWGTGTPTREFLYVDDAAEAIATAALSHNDSRPVNLGTGVEISIQQLADKVAALCDYNGAIQWNGRMDGQPRRALHTRRATELLNWTAKTSLDDGLRRTIEWWRLAPMRVQ